MQLDQRKAGNALIVTPLEDRLDARVAADFKERMSELIASGHTKIALDLSKVEFIDSSGLVLKVSLALKTEKWGHEPGNAHILCKEEKARKQILPENQIG